MKATFTPAAAKALAAMPKRDSAALMKKIMQFAAAPFAPNPAAKHLTGMNGAVRVRHGDWRAICRVNRGIETVVVEFVGNRKEIYR